MASVMAYGSWYGLWLMVWPMVWPVGMAYVWYGYGVTCANHARRLLKKTKKAAHNLEPPLLLLIYVWRRT